MKKAIKKKPFKSKLDTKRCLHCQGSKPRFYSYPDKPDKIYLWCSYCQAHTSIFNTKIEAVNAWNMDKTREEACPYCYMYGEDFIYAEDSHYCKYYYCNRCDKYIRFPYQFTDVSKIHG